jgi:hypothetical protein
LFSLTAAEFIGVILTQGGVWMTGAANHDHAYPKRVQFFACLFAFYSPKMRYSFQLPVVGGQR